MKNILIAVGALCLVSCASPQVTSSTPISTQPSQPLQQPQSIEQMEAEVLRQRAEMRNQIISPALAFEKERPIECSSPTLRTAVARAMGFTAALSSLKKTYLETAGVIARSTLDVADIAKRNKCKEHARLLYDLILETYVGTAYAAYRERAIVGINDLRHQN